MYSPAKAAQDTRLTGLDSLRGIAAMAVVFYHYTYEYGLKHGFLVEPDISFPYGRYGVQLFFVISGYVIFLTLGKTKKIWDFIANRIIRLYPPYWVGIGVTCLTLWYFLPFEKNQPSLPQVLANLTMLQYWLRIPHVDGVYWTLSVELVFYAWVGTLHLLKWLPRVEGCIAVWLSMQIAIKCLEPAYTVPPLFRNTLLLEHGHFFFSGILLYLMKQQGSSAFRWLLITVCVLTAWVVRDMPHAVALAVSIVLVLAVNFTNLAVLTFPPLLFLGSISYPLYLVHQNIGYSVIARLQSAGLTSTIWLVLPVIFSLLLSTGIHFLIEKPSLPWLRNLWKSSKLRARLA